SAWARRTAGGMADDLACGRAVRVLAAEAPDGARSFALAVACAQQDKLRDLRLLFLRPWSSQLFELSDGEAARLLGPILALRGGVPEDVAFCRYRGIHLHPLRDLAETDRRAERFVLFRGRVLEAKQRAGGGTWLAVEEASTSDLLHVELGMHPHMVAGSGWRSRAVKNASTGRNLDGVAVPGLSVAPGSISVFLARVGGDASAEFLAAWPVGLPLPSMAENRRDRGIDAQDLEVERYQLANGLTVLLHRDASLPLVHVNVTYRVGAYHEARGRSGFAHLFEHMMFQGSRDVGPGQHMALLQSRGASLVNAFTGFDRTSYVQTLPSHELELALWLEADRMATLPEGLSAESLEREKRVVRNERRQRTEDAAYGAVDQLVLRHLFPTGHPYREGVIGAVKDLEEATVEDARGFFEDFYSPANATLVVAGHFEPEQVRAWIEAYFGSIPPRVVRRVPPPAPPGLEGSKLIRMRAPLAHHTRITLVWPGPSPYQVGAAELDLFAHLLDAGGAGYLAAELESLRFDVREARATLHQTLAGTWFQVDVVVGRGTHEDDHLLLALERIVGSFRSGGLLDEDIGALARIVERSALFSLETLQARAATLAYYDHLFLDPTRLRWELARYQRITAPSFTAALNTYLGPEHLVFVASPKQ
ncbi:MAG: insulinase family protein, partial [Myxococcales bacterium]|nr:insulinase family protein [Myxococcales bacterium]